MECDVEHIQRSKNEQEIGVEIPISYFLKVCDFLGSWTAWADCAP
jgi:hypothetical protein